MIADTARRVGGDLLNVRALMGSGVDPHAYRQTRSDIVAMTRADLVLWHGLYLEAQMERFFEDLSRKRTVVAVADDLPRDASISHADYEGRYDPHVWMNPALWTHVVNKVAATLTTARPQDAATFAANAAVLKAELEQLVVYSTNALQKVVPAQRVLLTAHDAFSYFGRAYG